MSSRGTVVAAARIGLGLAWLIYLVVWLVPLVQGLTAEVDAESASAAAVRLWQRIAGGVMVGLALLGLRATIFGRLDAGAGTRRHDGPRVGLVLGMLAVASAVHLSVGLWLLMPLALLLPAFAVAVAAGLGYAWVKRPGARVG